MVLTGRGDRRRAYLYFVLALAAFGLLCFTVPLPKRYDSPRNALVQHVTDLTKDHLLDGIGNSHEKGLAPQSKYAFATFLASDSQDSQDASMDNDEYFVATRILAYQILHAPETQSANDFIVLVNEGVSEAKRERLRQDGAIVWQPESIDPKWIITDVSTWQSVLGKLRLWELVEYERVCFLDGDTILTRRMDGIFEDPAVQAQSAGTDAGHIRDDEGPLPRQYVFAGIQEMSPTHSYPPTEENHDWPNFWYLNAGCFVLQPSLELLKYYLSLIDTPGRFPPQLPEQNLLNYAHRPEGNMPWKHRKCTGCWKASWQQCSKHRSRPRSKDKRSWG